MTKEHVPRDATEIFVDTYGATRVSALRQIYGNGFASGIDGRKTLAEVVKGLEPASLQELVRDHERKVPHGGSAALTR